MSNTVPSETPASRPAGDPFELLFVGTHGHVVAVHKFTGKEVWRTSLPDTGWSVVSLLQEDGVLFAASKGHVFALDPASGTIFWSNALPGLGHDHTCIATMRQASPGGASSLLAAASDEDAARNTAAVT